VPAAATRAVATYPEAMPEGDTIHRAADALRRALGERPLVGFDAPRARGPRPHPGERINAVEALGKHLLIRFSGGSTLHTHLRMNGSWDIYDPRARWRRAPHRARAVVRTDTAVGVCFDAPVVELLDSRDVARHPILSALGPDLAAPEPDLNDALGRFSRLPNDPIGVALLDQRVSSGIGNVYKSEVLFACRIDPRARVADLSEAVRRDLLATAAGLLRANLGPGRRRTVPEGLAVYRRAGRSCRRCGERIVSFRQGEQARITYACPSCQTGARCD
jgi:endonuclease VIII